MAAPYIPDQAPFFSTEDGFRVYETERPNHYLASSPTAITYGGDFHGVAKFIQRERTRLKSAR